MHIFNIQNKVRHVSLMFSNSRIWRHALQPPLMGSKYFKLRHQPFIKYHHPWAIICPRRAIIILKLSHRVLLVLLANSKRSEKANYQMLVCISSRIQTPLYTAKNWGIHLISQIWCRACQLTLQTTRSPYKDTPKDHLLRSGKVLLV